MNSDVLTIQITSASSFGEDSKDLGREPDAATRIVKLLKKKDDGFGFSIKVHTFPVSESL